MWILYVLCGLVFAVATGYADGNAVFHASQGWERNPNNLFPSLHLGHLLFSVIFFGAGIILYHLYVGVMIQANVKSALLQSLVWITIMTIVVAMKDQVLQRWTFMERALAVAVCIQLLLLVFFTGKHE